MKKYVEFYDTETDGFVRAVDALNKFVAENESLKVSVIGYQVVKAGSLIQKERLFWRRWKNERH